MFFRKPSGYATEIIIVNRLYIPFLCSRKTNTKYYNKKRKHSVTRNIVASKKKTRFRGSGKFRSNIKS